MQPWHICLLCPLSLCASPSGSELGAGRRSTSWMVAFMWGVLYTFYHWGKREHKFTTSATCQWTGHSQCGAGTTNTIPLQNFLFNPQ